MVEREKRRILGRSKRLRARLYLEEDMKKLWQKLMTLGAFVSVALVSVAALAQEHAAGEAAAGGEHGTGYGMLAIGIAFGIGIAAMGGTFGQGRTAAAALEGIARNPNASDKVFVPMILGLAFIESLVLFTWVLMLLIQLKM
jgi:F-type H+-transporting ATPase subunit c